MHLFQNAEKERQGSSGSGKWRGAGNSGRSYDYARFTVIGGYDHSSEGFGAAEVVQGHMRDLGEPLHFFPRQGEIVPALVGQI